MTLPPLPLSPPALMARACRLAERGLTTATPNPRVGAMVIDSNGQIAGEGWHERAGGPHAEIVALQAAGERARGGSLIVTLEPCAHHGRTPPCVDAIIAAEIRAVYYGMVDPNPLVSGRGIERLTAAGVTCIGPIETTAVQALNLGFIRRMTAGRPAFFLKTAVTLDGRVALAGGQSRWITGPESRRLVHRLRAASCAILTGVGTVLSDNPALTVRHIPCHRPPIRLLLDSTLRLPLTARLLLDRSAPTWILTTPHHDFEKRRKLEAMGIRIIETAATPDGRVDLSAAATLLAAESLNEILVEAGPHLIGSLLSHRLIDRWYHFIAPKLLGSDAQPLLPPLSLSDLTEAPRFHLTRLRRVGSDLLLTLEPTPSIP